MNAKQRAPATGRTPVSRRGILRVGLGSAGLIGTGALAHAGLAKQTPTGTTSPVGEHAGRAGQPEHGRHAMGVMPGVQGEVDHAKNGFDPTEILTDFDGGTVSTLANGQTLREYAVVAYDREIELVPGLTFPAWTYNGRIPGPTIRATEGDRLRIHFVNAGSHPHSMHFHGIHPGNVDGVFGPESGLIPPGAEFTYEFDAEPFGCHLYHCHAFPLAAHIAKGLYGAFIVDPKQGRPKVDREMVMVMSGFDVDFDGENDFYVVNGIPFHYDHGMHPIKLKVGQSIRIFLINILEYDPINSFHLHANFFHYYPTGTSLTPRDYTDTVGLMQAERGILEFTYKYPGRYMFHAHKTEFAELGWTGVFEVEE